MAKIDLAEAKWYKKAIAGFRKTWLTMVKKADSFEAFVNGIADFLGISPATVRASLPAKNWAEFQRNAEQYVDVAIRKIQRAFERHKWKRKLIEAFSTPG